MYVFSPTYSVEKVQTQCTLHIQCMPKCLGRGKGQVGQEEQYWKQYTLLKESGLLLVGTLSQSEHLVAEAVLASTE